MKRVIITLTSIALSISTISGASAITMIQGGPYTNLDPVAGKIHLNLSNYPTTKGLYIFQVVRNRASSNARPTVINMDNAVDVTTSMNHADVVFTAVGSFTTSAGVTDCSKVECALWEQYDGASGSYNVTDEDQYISSLSFAAAADAVAAHGRRDACCAASGAARRRAPVGGGGRSQGHGGLRVLNVRQEQV